MLPSAQRAHVPRRALQAILFELSKITEAFYMVDKSRSRKQHGSGIGLALSAKIANIHGSSLEFSSVEGVGTIVKIDLALGGTDDE